MTERDRTADKRECGGDVAAYALGALEPAEAEAFRKHLETCAVCQEELASFQQVVNELPLAAPPQKAPATVRRKVMREVAADARRKRHPSAPGGARRSGAPSWLTPRPVLAMGVVLLVAIGVVIGVSSSSSGPGTRVINAQVVGGGSAQMRIAHGKGSLVVRGFAQPPPGKIYEVWLVRGKNPPSPTSALFSVTSAGNGVVAVPGSLRGVSNVLVTPEPMGGSRTPTHTPVISVSLT
jgi:anti-sigma-K factor RskA